MSLWSPGAIYAHAKELGRKHLAADVKVQAHAVQRKDLPAILTLNHLAEMTEVEYDVLRDAVRRRRDFYTEFQIKKRSGGYRNIVCPDPQLKRIQRWISQHVLRRTTPHSASAAYAPGSSIVDAAEMHCGARWLVKIDITSFFESISEIDVYRVFRECGYTSLVAFELARICTRVTDSYRYRRRPWWVIDSREQIQAYQHEKMGHLPQGAPSSPMLANLVMRGADEAITETAEKAHLAYSRYSDDLIFSTSDEDFGRPQAEQLVRDVEGILAKRGLRTNRNKTRMAPPGARKVVLGLVVNDAKPRLPKRITDGIEVHLHFAERNGIAAHASARRFNSTSGFLAHLDGLITYAEMVDAKRGKAYRTRLDELLAKIASNT
jgi:RNA-directed DNA polymerase